jgi:hypothetical protein
MDFRNKPARAGAGVEAPRSDAITSRPLRSTSSISLLAALPGFFVPCSQAATVVSPTLRWAAKTP